MARAGAAMAAGGPGAVRQGVGWPQRFEPGIGSGTADTIADGPRPGGAASRPNWSKLSADERKDCLAAVGRGRCRGSIKCRVPNKEVAGPPAQIRSPHTSACYFVGSDTRRNPAPLSHLILMFRGHWCGTTGKSVHSHAAHQRDLVVAQRDSAVHLNRRSLAVVFLLTLSPYGTAAEPRGTTRRPSNPPWNNSASPVTPARARRAASRSTSVRMRVPRRTTNCGGKRSRCSGPV